MAGAKDMPAQLLVVGANHQSSSVMLRDEIFVDDQAMTEVLAECREHGIEQAIVLSTCDRVEVQGAAPDPSQAAEAITAILASRAAVDPAALDAQVYAYAGPEAARHIFAVACSLDSQTIGEPQVLGQVKASHRIARGQDMVGPELEAALQAAYGVAKQVRSETAIGERPVSIAAAAVQSARDLHGDLDRVSALLLGDGEMGEMIVEAMQQAGLGGLTVTAPGAARAEALARRLDCHTTAFDGFAAGLPEADIVVAALGAREHAIPADLIVTALRRRRRRPIYLVDAGVPGDIDPAIERIDEAFLFSLDDLERVAMDGRATREQAAAEAWAIVDQGLAAFLKDRAERRAAPAIADLRAHFDAVRAEVLAEAGAADADEITRRLVNRLLHEPSAALRKIAAQGGAEARNEAERSIRRLFGLGAGRNRPADKTKTDKVNTDRGRKTP